MGIDSIILNKKFSVQPFFLLIVFLIGLLSSRLDGSEVLASTTAQKIDRAMKNLANGDDKIIQKAIQDLAMSGESKLESFLNFIAKAVFIIGQLKMVRFV